MIELVNISKQYPGSTKKANNNISLDLRQGEILCITGENGAGKTTLMKILMGLEIPDTGDIFIHGKKEIINSPLAANKLGIGMVHQHFMLFPEYTTAENIVMGVEPCKWGVFYDKKAAIKTADNIINGFNFSVKSSQKVKELSLGEMQQVEICRILNRNAQIIILDEPASILTEQETQSLFETLKKFVSAGKSIILITHKLHQAKQISNRIAILRKGELTGIYNTNEIDETEISRLMIGTAFPPSSFTPNLLPDTNFPDSTPVIEFKNITVKRHGQKQPLLDGVSFRVNSGEILGFAGVGGNGLGVIEAVLGGFLHPEKGKILHKGNDITGLSIRCLRKQGLAYVPADRIRVGSAAEATIGENFIINRRNEFFKGIFFDKKKAEKFSDELVKNYNIESSHEYLSKDLSSGDSSLYKNEKLKVLSGGNLQKLILAREINWFKDYIVLSEPSWGLDINSSRFITEEIKNLRRKGAAVILISTNLDEILELTDRIIVMYKGKISGEFINTGDISIKEEIGKCMQGLIV